MNPTRNQNHMGNLFQNQTHVENRTENPKSFQEFGGEFKSVGALGFYWIGLRYESR